MNRVITISREFGSGGRTIGRQAADRLGLKCYDQELIDRIAEDYLRQVAAIVHSETDSLFSPMSAMRGVEYRLMPGLDAVSETPFPHNPEKMAHLAEF